MVRPAWTKLACGQALAGAGAAKEAGASAERGCAEANMAREIEWAMGLDAG